MLHGILRDLGVGSDQLLLQTVVIVAAELLSHRASGVLLQTGSVTLSHTATPTHTERRDVFVLLLLLGWVMVG
jgi:hypothetical protein